jgi:hypothetical protein
LRVSASSAVRESSETNADPIVPATTSDSHGKRTTMRYIGIATRAGAIAAVILGLVALVEPTAVEARGGFGGSGFGGGFHGVGLAGFAAAGSAGEARDTGADGLAVSIRATTAGAMAVIRMATMGTLTPMAHTPTTVIDRRLVPRSP